MQHSSLLLVSRREREEEERLWYNILVFPLSASQVKEQRSGWAREEYLFQFTF